jgi:hypothetical protein
MMVTFCLELLLKKLLMLIIRRTYPLVANCVFFSSYIPIIHNFTSYAYFLICNMKWGEFIRIRYSSCLVSYWAFQSSPNDTILNIWTFWNFLNMSSQKLLKKSRIARSLEKHHLEICNWYNFVSFSIWNMRKYWFYIRKKKCFFHITYLKNMFRAKNKQEICTELESTITR